jgi:hypothetical protein
MNRFILFSPTFGVFIAGYPAAKSTILSSPRGEAGSGMYLLHSTRPQHFHPSARHPGVNGRVVHGFGRYHGKIEAAFICGREMDLKGFRLLRLQVKIGIDAIVADVLKIEI